MKKIFFVLGCFSLFSCQNNNSYKYIEIKEEVSDSGDVEEIRTESTITAMNDTLAFLDAYQKYLGEKKVKEITYRKLNKSHKIKGFNLYDPKGNNISDISFVTKDKAIKEMESRINTTKTSDENDIQKQKESSIDSVKIKELVHFFNERKDEFEGISWIENKQSPKYRNQNGFYLYFMRNKEGGISNLRFVGQYEAEDWLFIRSLKLNINGNIWEYTPKNIKSDHDSRIWEWFDDSVSSDNALLIEAIAYSENPIKVRFIGKQYYGERTISKKDIKSIQQTLEYYKALGGKY